MAAEEIPPELQALVEKLGDEYRDSEFAIAEALAEADGPLSIDDLADETGYTDRTVTKRVDTLEERLGGEPLLRRADEGPALHPKLARAIRERSV